MKNMPRSVSEIADKTWLINEYNIVNMYLLEGMDRALLIDCGCGFGDVPAEVRRLTDKPITVVITHSHPDHDGSSAQFDHVYMHPADILLSNQTYPRTSQFRDIYVRSQLPKVYPQVPAEEILATAQEVGSVNRRPVEEGYVFQLGNRDVQVIHTPGHSEGSICLLDGTTRLLFTGDSCNDHFLVLDPDWKQGLQRALKTFDKLWSLQDQFDFICQGHNAQGKAEKRFISDYIEAIHLLLDGAQGEPDTGTLFDGMAFHHNRISIRYALHAKTSYKY